MIFKTGDRVMYDGLLHDGTTGYRGTVVEYVPAQGSFVAVCVVKFDHDSQRHTVWAADLVPESAE